jgi:thioesterase domain-containing protein
VNANPPQSTDAGDPARTHLPDNRDELLSAVRKQNPDLQAEDAFAVPTWFVQQKTWFEDAAGSDSAVYNIPILLRIRGPLNEGALQQGLQEIVRRNGALRSVFRIMDGRLIQIVVAQQEFSLPVTQLDASLEAREQQMREAARTEAMQPFDLARGPMYRGKLMRLQTDEHVLQLTAHHLNYDDWSNGVLIRELSELYCAYAAGTAPPGEASPFQYGDFIRWQHKRLQSPEIESQQAYCKNQLDFAGGFEHLPTDFPRPAQNTNAGGCQTVIVPAAQADSLKALCRQERVSLFMVLLAGFTCLLHRYSGDEEIGLGSCAANRPLLEVEGLIGRFGNSMLLRTTLSGNPTFSELLKRVREVTLNASSNLETPFGMVLERLGRPAGRNLIHPYQVMFILQNAPKERWQLPGLNVDWMSLETGTSKHDLNVWLKNEPALEITFEYSTQLFESASVSRFLADYQAILNTMAKDPTERVANIRISARPEPVGAKSIPFPVNGKTGEALRKGCPTHNGVEGLHRESPANSPQPVGGPENIGHAREESLSSLDSSGASSSGEQQTPVGHLLNGRDVVVEEPQNQIERAVSEIWSSLLGVTPIRVEENFFAVGGDSLLAMQITSRIRTLYKVDFSLRYFFANPTISGVAAQIDALLAAGKETKGADQGSSVAESGGDLVTRCAAFNADRRKPELIQVHGGNSGPELIFLIDEGSLGLFKLAHLMSKDVSLYASSVPLPESVLKASLNKQFAALPRMEDLAAEHAALIKNRQTHGPVLLAGHCFGGLMAFEVAHQLQRAGKPVEAVVMLDTWMTAPPFWWNMKTWFRAHTKRLRQRGLPYLWRKSLRRINLEKDKLASRLNLSIQGDFNAHVPWSIIERIYGHAMSSYCPTVLENRGILLVSRDDWHSNAYRQLDYSLGASKWFSGGVEVRDVPGDHVTILDEPHLPELAECFGKSLEKLR